MKALTVLIFSAILLFPVALIAEEKEILDDTPRGYLYGRYHGFTVGTPGALDFHIGYMEERAGVSLSVSTLAMATPIIFLSNTFIFMKSGDWNGEDFIRNFFYFSGQVNFYFNISRGENHIFAISLFGGGVYYSLEGSADKVALVYGGVAVNLFYKNFFVQAGIVGTYNYEKSIFVSKYPVLPSLQVGYVFQF